MALLIPEPIVVTEKVFDTYWISSLQILSPTVGGEAYAEISLVPYNATTGESDQSKAKSLRIDGIFEQISAGDSSLAAAMGAIIAAIGEKVERTL